MPDDTKELVANSHKPTPKSVDEKPLHKSANENPWYVLMTLYGEVSKKLSKKEKRELIDKNRRAWNAWAGQALSEDQKSEASLVCKIESTDLEAWDQLEQEVRGLFQAKLMLPEGEEYSHSLLPSPSEDLSLERFSFPKGFYCKGFVFPMKMTAFDTKVGSGFYLTRSWFCRSLDLVLDVSGGVSFSEAKFCEDASFALEVSRGAFFSKAVFCKRAWFHLGKFEALAFFKEVQFSGIADFTKNTFEGGVDFGGSNFCELSYFNKTVFGKAGGESAARIGFADCVFAKTVRFREAVFHNLYPSLTGTTLHERAYFSSEDKYWPDTTHVWIATQKGYTAAKSSCAAIRHNLSKQGLPEEEHFFFRKEMLFAGKIGSIWQRLPYLLFGLFSDYGHSIARPTFWLAGIWAFGFVAFWGYFSGCCVPAPLDVTERPMGTAMGLSFSNLFPLFGFGRTFLAAELAGLPAVLKTLAGFQTVFSLPLLFFLGLGLRQRFRLR